MFGFEGFGAKKKENGPQHETDPQVMGMLRNKMAEVADVVRGAGHNVTEQDIDMATVAIATEAARNGQPYTEESIDAIDINTFAQKLEQRVDARPEGAAHVIDTSRGEVVQSVHSPSEARRVIEEQRENA